MSTVEHADGLVEESSQVRALIVLREQLYGVFGAIAHGAPPERERSVSLFVALHGMGNARWDRTAGAWSRSGDRTHSNRSVTDWRMKAYRVATSDLDLAGWILRPVRGGCSSTRLAPTPGDVCSMNAAASADTDASLSPTTGERDGRRVRAWCSERVRASRARTRKGASWPRPLRSQVGIAGLLSWRSLRPSQADPPFNAACRSRPASVHSPDACRPTSHRVSGPAAFNEAIDGPLQRHGSDLCCIRRVSGIGCRRTVARCASLDRRPASAALSWWTQMAGRRCDTDQCEVVAINRSAEPDEPSRRFRPTRPLGLTIVGTDRRHHRSACDGELRPDDSEFDRAR